VTAYRTAQPVDTADSYRQLRALRVVDGQGWAAYTAAERHWGRHLLTLPDNTRRVLLRGEPLWWAWGNGTAWGQGHLIGGLLTEEIPQLLTLPEAAQAYAEHTGEPTTTAMIDYRIRVGQLYPVYGTRLRRSVFAAQVTALAAARYAEQVPGRVEAGRARAARRTWNRLAERLPAPRPVWTPPEQAPPARRLPIPVGKPEATRRLQALVIGDAAGWWRLAHPAGTGYLILVRDPARAEAGYTVEVHLPGPAVLPYALGAADRHGRAAEVAYRPGLLP
jgi:hypothetical protein